MRFRLKLYKTAGREIPINYQYPLSAAIYRILNKGDAEYASFLHEKGYGKGYKFFTFSDVKGKFRRNGDRLQLIDNALELIVCFHLPETAKTFIEGLFRSEEIDIADKESKASFKVESIISLENPFKENDEKELIQILCRPLSMIVSGEKDIEGNYQFLNPDDLAFSNALSYSWKNKIHAAYGENEEEEAILMIEVEKYKNPWRSRLVTIKANTDAETKIKGYLNFKLRLTAERRYLDLILNAGMGLYSAQGMGCLEVVSQRVYKTN